MTLLRPFILAALLAGCSPQVADNIRHEAEAYKDAPRKIVTIDGTKWQVKDNGAGLFILASSYDAAFDDGLRKGATLGMAKDRGQDIEYFRGAAASYAAGKGCHLGEGRVMQKHMSEFSYTC